MFTHLAFLDLSTPDLLIILAIILLLFGAKKLPELSKSLGQSVRELRQGLNGESQNKNKNEEHKDTTDQQKN